jgi:hypothetical protein
VCRPAFAQLGIAIDNPRQESDLKRRRKFEKWRKKLTDWAVAERAATGQFLSGRRLRTRPPPRGSCSCRQTTRVAVKST